MTIAIRTRVNFLPARFLQTGVSLIELMVALALGVILLLGLVEIFGSVRASFNAAEGRARIQESGRFSLEFLRRDVRMAGHFGCYNEFYFFPTERLAIRQSEPGSNGTSDRGFYNHFVLPDAGSIRDNAPYPTQLHRPIEVYDFGGTSPSNAYTITSATPAPTGAAGSWTPALPDGATQLNGIAGRAVPGSDILVVRYFDEQSIPLAGVAGVLSLDNVNGVIQLDSSAGIQQWAPYGLTQCQIATLFQVTAIPNATSVIASGGRNLPRAANFAFDNATGSYSAGSLMYRYRFFVYYVGQNANGVPGLFRQTLIAAPGDQDEGLQLGPAVELVEGVEMMQIVAGVDSVLPRVDQVTAYVSPSALLAGPSANNATYDAALSQITSLRISLLIRSNTAAAGAERARDTIVVGDVNVTLPDDFSQRQVYDTTIAIRNRIRT